MSKYVFLTGGVVSGLGKGITTASLGRLIKERGYSVEIVKFNPYFNMDSSNLSPELYGEKFITEDGKSCDLVIGHYERILGGSITSRNYITSGEIYSLIIEKEKNNFYEGKTVQVVPHITDEIKKCILRVGEKADIVLVELGGTVGDIEAQPYMEAVRQLRLDLGKNNVAYVHVALLTSIEVSGEQKTKPIQHSVKQLLNLGIQPDVIVCRSDFLLSESSRKKLSLFCNVKEDCIIESIVTPNIYEIPLYLEKEGFCKVILRKLMLEDRPVDLSDLENFCKRTQILESDNAIKIGILDTYAEKDDVTMSLRHSLLISAVEQNQKVEVVPINTNKFSNDKLKNLHGLIITADISDDSIAAKKSAVEFSYANNLPLLMLGDSAFLGLQSGGDSNTFKANEKEYKFGLYPIEFKENSMLYQLYGKISEQRFSSKIYVPKSFFEGINLKLSGICADGSVAAYEHEEHKFFVGAFFRPEFNARPNKPSPIVSALIKAAKGK